tara:strand:+ start:29 stop:439 length:411 start_codon:yes stop_codon:yes gene_type:complete
MGKGQKICPECNAVNGARAYQCKVCDYAFPNKYGKIRYSKRPVRDWRDLKRGDCVRVVGGSGTYYLNPETGERTYMSSKGKYKVDSLTGNGIVAYGIGKNNTGCEFIYMGEHIQSELCDNMYKAPHKLVRINEPRR